MAEEQTEPQDSQEPVGDDDTPLENLATDEAVNDQQSSLEEQMADLREKNKKLYARTKRSEERMKLLEKEQPPRPPEAPKTLSQDVEERVELRLQGYSTDEVAFIRTTAGGNSLLEAAKIPYVRAGIEAIREKEKAAKATPGSSGKSPQQPSPRTLKDLKPEERAQNFSFESWRERRRTNQT